MELGLRGKKALVTGASKGIGRACAEALAEEGCDVALVARTAADLEAARTAITARHNVAVRIFPLDLSQSGNVDRLAPPLDLYGFGRALARRATLLRAWMMFFEEYPLVLMPVSCEPPFPAGFDRGDEAALIRLVVAQRPQFPPAVLGLPAISVPTGVVDGVPIGVQLIAGRFREDLCLDAAEAIEARAPMPTPIDPRP